MIKVGIATDHGGFALKQILHPYILSLGYEVVDFGAFERDDLDDYPDYVVPLARAVAAGTVQKGVAICGSGVGATIAANKVKGARACLITDYFSAHQGVEDDDMNLICLGGRITGFALAQEIVQVFLLSSFKDGDKYGRRLNKIRALEE